MFPEVLIQSAVSHARVISDVLQWCVFIATSNILQTSGVIDIIVSDSITLMFQSHVTKHLDHCDSVLNKPPPYIIRIIISDPELLFDSESSKNPIFKKILPLVRNQHVGKYVAQSVERFASKKRQHKIISQTNLTKIL